MNRLIFGDSYSIKLKKEYSKKLYNEISNFLLVKAIYVCNHIRPCPECGGSGFDECFYCGHEKECELCYGEGYNDYIGFEIVEIDEKRFDFTIECFECDAIFKYYNSDIKNLEVQCSLFHFYNRYIDKRRVYGSIKDWN